MGIGVAGVVVAGEPAPLVTPLDPQVRVDWTNLHVEIVTSAVHPTFKSDPSFAEQVAIGENASRLTSALDELPIRDGVLGAQVPGVSARATSLWGVRESRYHQGGRVEVVGAVDLLRVLEPWMASRSLPPPLEVDEVEASGVVIDARGAGAAPCYAPRILDVDQKPLYEGKLWQDVAGGTPPARWVGSPANPMAARTAGDAPVLLRAQGATGCTITLDDASSSRWAREVEGARMVGEGRLVFVVDQEPASAPRRDVSLAPQKSENPMEVR